MLDKVEAIEARTDELQRILTLSTETPVDTMALITLAARLIVARAQEKKQLDNLAMPVQLAMTYFAAIVMQHSGPPNPPSPNR